MRNAEESTDAFGDFSKKPPDFAGVSQAELWTNCFRSGLGICDDLYLNPNLDLLCQDLVNFANAQLEAPFRDRSLKWSGWFYNFY